MKDGRNTPLIQVEDLKMYYPVKGGIISHTTGFIRAVDGISFSIMEGETLGLVGESGCGKSPSAEDWWVWKNLWAAGFFMRGRICLHWEEGT